LLTASLAAAPAGPAGLITNGSSSSSRGSKAAPQQQQQGPSLAPPGSRRKTGGCEVGLRGANQLSLFWKGICRRNL
jgi:hypothetical protein